MKFRHYRKELIRFETPCTAGLSDLLVNIFKFTQGIFDSIGVVGAILIRGAILIICVKNITN